MSYMKRRKEDMDIVLELVREVWYQFPHLTLIEVLDMVSDREVEVIDETDLDRVLIDKLNTFL